jgi:hypothetical protein
MPDVIERLCTEAEDHLRRSLQEQPEEYEAVRGPNDPANLYEYMEQRQPGFVADFGICMLPDLLNHPPVAKKIFEMYWWPHHFKGATVDLLTSDRPLIIVPRLDDNHCVMALPLTPHLAFFATHSLIIAKRVASTPTSRLARLLNHETVRLADQYVYAANRNQEAFIRQRFPFKG